LTNLVLTAETAHINLSPHLFHLYACEYLHCESTFQSEARYSPVPYFLLCRAMELEFKAQHLESKSRDAVKKEYGHNLKKSYDDLPTQNKTLGPAEYEVLVRANKIYDKPKGFEYVSIGDAVTALRDFPDLGVLRDIATKVAKSSPLEGREP
jgi:hypothetical protein